MGSKYIYELGKIPKMQASIHAMTHVNQMGIPIKTKNQVIRMQHATNPTPIQLGEDEVGLLSMFLSPSEVARFMHSRAGSRSTAELMASALFTDDKPSDISKFDIEDDDIIKNSDTISHLYDMMAVSGFDIGETSSGRG